MVKEKLIADKFLSEFLSLFDEIFDNSGNKIVWIGNLNLLKYFIDQIYKRKIINDPIRKLFTIAESRFSFVKINTKDNKTEIHNFLPNFLSARKDPVDTEIIDHVIDNLLDSSVQK